jgi:hypothetical protein
LKKVEKSNFCGYIEMAIFINSHGEFTMKKLLTVSVLAATLASTAVFAAAGTPGGPGLPGLPGTPVTKNASQTSAAGESKQTPELLAKISQALKAQGIESKKSVIEFNRDGSLRKARIDLPKKLAPNVAKGIQNAVGKLVEEKNKEAGYQAVSYEAPAGGKILFILSAISRYKGNDAFKSYIAQLVNNDKAIEIIQEKTGNSQTSDNLKTAYDKAKAEGVVKPAISGNPNDWWQ